MNVYWNLCVIWALCLLTIAIAYIVNKEMGCTHPVIFTDIGILGGMFMGIFIGRNS
jgi:hypothetical protein